MSLRSQSSVLPMDEVHVSLVSRGQTAFFRSSLWWRKKGLMYYR